MKKLLLLIGITFNIVAAEDVVPESRFKKIKTALVSKEAIITYGVVGLVASSALTYFVVQGKRLAACFDVLDTISGQFDLAEKYDLSYRALKNENFHDNNNAFTVVLEVKSLEDEPKLWKLARDGQLASWFTKHKIKVTPVIKDKKVNVIIDISKSK